MIVSVDSTDLIARLDRIQLLAEQLTKSKDITDQADISERLQREIANTKAVLTIYAGDDRPS
jgi:hypothetical protein